MIILSVDTSGPVAGVALLKEGRLVYESYLDHRLKHAQVLMPMIDKALEAAQTQTGEIDCFACTVGPGSFTGVRIGVSTVKALAYALGKSVLGVNTLDALAYNVVTHGGHICAVMDARCAQVYTALYVSDGQTLKRMQEPCALSVEECMHAWPGKASILLVGDGAQAYRDEWAKDERTAFAPAHCIGLHASAVGAYAQNMLSKGMKAYDPIALEPLYLRLPQAEREYRRRLRKTNE